MAYVLALLADRRGWCWYHPQWWVWGAALSAWLVLLAADLNGQGRLPAGLALNLLALCRVPQSWALDASGLWLPLDAWLGGWALMLLAMMYPLLNDNLRALAFASPWSRRHRAMVGFLAGYTMVWLLYGLLAGALLLLCFRMLSGALLAALFAPASIALLGFGTAVAWVYTPMRRRALVACHAVHAPLGSGWQADSACACHGLRIGWACLRNCWAIMTALMLTGHGLPAMLLAATVLLWERKHLRHARHGVAACWLGLLLWSSA
ncbi:copper chaperone [Chitinimonas sp. JJ19]|uniref:copper chaperone n=1 Tax=Chitinimonas sp. JJ19 TaxID=3109352 RepID=UPI003001B6A1